MGVDHNELVIYQGRIGGFLWYDPVAVKKTGVTTADVPANYVPALESGVEKTSVADAETYVANLKTAKEQQGSPAPTASVPSSGAPTTTKGA